MMREGEPAWAALAGHKKVKKNCAAAASVAGQEFRFCAADVNAPREEIFVVEPPPPPTRADSPPAPPSSAPSASRALHSPRPP